MKPFATPQTRPDLPPRDTGLSIGLPVLVVAVVVAAACVAAYFKSQRWRAFAAEHECQAVGKMAGDVTPTVGFDAKGWPMAGVAFESDRVGWKCNDGITYWR